LLQKIAVSRTGFSFLSNKEKLKMIWLDLLEFRGDQIQHRIHV